MSQSFPCRVDGNWCPILQHESNRYWAGFFHGILITLLVTLALFSVRFFGS